MLPRRVTGLAISLLALPYLALAGDYDGCTTVSQIPWLNTANDPWDWGLSPRVAVWFTKRDTDVPARLPLEYQVDTGSCGIIATKDDVKFDDLTEKITANIGYQWLSSSEILYTGWWVWRWVWFNKGDPAKEVKSYVQVLAIDQKLTKCEHWDPSQGASCTGSTPDPNPKTQLMGISWGRMYDGQPQGDPTRNPLLQVKKAGSGDINHFCPGWILDSYGINLGLDNTRWPPGGPPGSEGPIEVKLGTDPGADPAAPPSPVPYHYAWGEIPGCVQVQNPTDTSPEPCVEASILLDTGMNPDKASIRLPQSNVNTLSRTGSHELNPGHTVTVKVGNRGWTLWQIETYTNNDTPFYNCDITPEKTTVYADDPMYHSPARFPFANVGRHAYRRMDTGFDPRRGRARIIPHPLLQPGVPQKLDPYCVGGCGMGCACRACSP
ncbi:hypothetical protein B0H63DRAFT_555224 [Podospora didyma]|uniref:Uncharacterized protein n=1 Tax=Podospora didyma TaxID=330526 RepID=A0AAE0U7J7_9PEZI|nr:hypothetical protein B0H63DRAFT_555224 [Podospora didyma]